MPWIDAKYYAATQVIDEARHVEVFAKYLDTKLEGHYTVNPALQLLIDDVIADSRWDMTYMGMQIMIEGLALAAFGFMHMVTQEPLLKQLLRYVMADEARHVAFGVISLKEYYDAARRRPRSSSARSSRSRRRSACATGSSCTRSGRRWGSTARRSRGCSSRSAAPAPTRSRPRCSPRSCPTARSSGCSTPATAGCATKFTEIGVIDFEDAIDTEMEYELLDAESAAVA